MAFEGFDLGIRDKYNNCLCVGDNIKDIFFDEELKQFGEDIGKIVYSPKKFCFGIDWAGEFVPLLDYDDNFWKGAEKCAKP